MRRWLVRSVAVQEIWRESHSERAGEGALFIRAAVEERDQQAGTKYYFLACTSSFDTMLHSQVASALSSGTGDFDEERILKELPKQLSLPERRVKSVINGQASDRKRDVLVQAVSMLRQRKLDEVVKCLNNLLACNKVRRLSSSQSFLISCTR